MLNIITDIFKPNEKNDTVFGPLKFRQLFILAGTGFWEGKAHFEPLEKTVNVYLTAGKSDSLEKEHEFFREIEKYYPEFINEVLDILYEILLQYNGADFLNGTREEVLAKSELDGIILPSAKDPNSEWSLSFRYLPQMQTYSIYFYEWSPLYGKLDD